MNKPKLSGCDTNGVRPPGAQTRRAAATHWKREKPASRPTKNVSGAASAPTSQNGSAAASGPAERSQMNGTWMISASGIQ